MIGESVLKKKSAFKGTGINTKAVSQDYKIQVLKTLQSSKRALNITEIQERAKIKSWHVVKSLLLELLLEGKVTGEKSGGIWHFWIPE